MFSNCILPTPPPPQSSIKLVDCTRLGVCPYLQWQCICFHLLESSKPCCMSCNNLNAPCVPVTSVLETLYPPYSTQLLQVVPLQPNQGKQVQGRSSIQSLFMTKSHFFISFNGCCWSEFGNSLVFTKQAMHTHSAISYRSFSF